MGALWFKWLKQRWTRGFDDRELWSLDHTIAAFVLPRLKALLSMMHGHPPDLTMDEWREVMGKMIAAMEFQTGDEFVSTPDYVIEGNELFGKYFIYLWD